MPPIPIYNNSPVAAKPEGATAQTAGGGGGEKAAAATTTGAIYPRAQPGAAPALPVPTGAAQTPTAAAPLQPTATQPLRSTEGPPPPQPGAVPTVPTVPTPTRTGGSSLPPPPKAGEKFVPPPPATPSAAPVPYPEPQQMSISPPTMAYPAQQHGTTMATAPPSLYGQTSGTTGSGSISSSNNHRLNHPPGYHQNAHASELDQYHQQAALSRNDSAGARADAAGEEGLWGAAKKLAQGAGERLVTAESEVWKRINKQ